VPSFPLQTRFPVTIFFWPHNQSKPFPRVGLSEAGCMCARGWGVCVCVCVCSCACVCISSFPGHFTSATPPRSRCARYHASCTGLPHDGARRSLHSRSISSIIGSSNQTPPLPCASTPFAQAPRGGCMRLSHVTFWCLVQPVSLALRRRQFSFRFLFFIFFLPQPANASFFVSAILWCPVGLITPGGRSGRWFFVAFVCLYQGANLQSQAPPLRKHRGGGC